MGNVRVTRASTKNELSTSHNFRFHPKNTNADSKFMRLEMEGMYIESVCVCVCGVCCVCLCDAVKYRLNKLNSSGISLNILVIYSMSSFIWRRLFRLVRMQIQRTNYLFHLHKVHASIKSAALAATFSNHTKYKMWTKWMHAINHIVVSPRSSCVWYLQSISIDCADHRSRPRSIRMASKLSLRNRITMKTQSCRRRAKSRRLEIVWTLNHRWIHICCHHGEIRRESTHCHRNKWLMVSFTLSFSLCSVMELYNTFRFFNAGITASQVRRLSERSGEGPTPKEAEFLATLSQAPQPSGRRHSVVTISKVPLAAFGRGRRESVAAYPSGSRCELTAFLHHTIHQIRRAFYK